MIVSYEEFAEKLNEKLFEGSYKDLIEKISENPHRYVGIFRSSKPQTKIVQNITQSHEIKFGAALENIFEQYFSNLGFNILNKDLISVGKDEDEDYSIDQLIEKNGVIYLIEQKVRDDHDSTKKKGQFDNFESKYIEVVKKYPQELIIPIMWFIDPDLKKNRKYYVKRIDNMKLTFNCNPKLYYGIGLFNTSEGGIKDIPVEMWNEICSYLEEWKKTLPDMPETNFDARAEDIFNEIKDVKPLVFKKIFSNERLMSELLPIIFTDGKLLSMLIEYYTEKASNKKYRDVLELMKKYYMRRGFKKYFVFSFAAEDADDSYNIN